MLQGGSAGGRLRVDDAERGFALAELALGAGDVGLELAFLLDHACLTGLQVLLPRVQAVGLELDVDFDPGAMRGGLALAVEECRLVLVDLLGAGVEVGLAGLEARGALLDPRALALHLLLDLRELGLADGELALAILELLAQRVEIAAPDTIRSQLLELGGAPVEIGLQLA